MKVKHRESEYSTSYGVHTSYSMEYGVWSTEYYLYSMQGYEVSEAGDLQCQSWGTAGAGAGRGKRKERCDASIT